MKKRLLNIFIALLLISLSTVVIFISTTASADKLKLQLQEGDIVFQTSGSNQSLAIFIASGSPYTHMGFLREREDGEFVVVEAVGPVLETPLAEWISHGDGGRLTVSRIKDVSKANVKEALQNAAKLYGKPYDAFFMPDDNLIYCSELVYKAYKDAGIELGKLQKFGDLNINNQIVRSLFSKRWEQHPGCRQSGAKTMDECWNIVLDQSIITPVSIADDKRLMTVYSNYPFK